MQDSFEGKLALVTGASSGIGHAVALSLAQRRCRLVLSGRDEGRLAVTASLCRDVAKMIVAGDITEAETQERLRDAAAPGPTDFIIHCAANAFEGSFADISVKTFRKMMETNVVAAYGLLKIFEGMLASGSNVILLNSTAGIQSGRPEVSAYGASKFALKAMVDSFRAEVNPRGIRVTSLYSGRVATPMLQRLYEQRGKGAEFERIKGDLPQPEHVARAILSALTMPFACEVTEIHLRPTRNV